MVTNYTSPEGYAYSVTTNNPVTCTEVDNAVGLGGVVLWSNPLTNAADSVNWTLTFASTNLFGVTTNPVIIANYSNAPVDPSLVPPGGGNYEVQFGYPIANDGIPPSDTMLQNGWTNALRMTCNKDFSYPSPSGVNVFPQGKTFAGNYALRFDMYLSLNTQATNNPNIGTYVREFAAFGVNHTGTNCMWRMDTGVIPTGQPGSGMTNFDGIWFSIDADVGSQTPADFDGFISPPLPNAGVPSDFISAANTVDTGIFKKPPFPCRTAAGGQPVDKWVDVSVELFRQTNCTLLVDRAGVFNPGNAALANFFTTNRGIYVSPGVWVPTYTNGTIMLGYIDPIKNVSDESSFVYYSNVRVVELSPYILVQPVSLLVTQGATFYLTNSANLATAPLTNMWYRSTTNIPATLTGLVLSNSVAATNLTTILGVTNILNGTNYTAVFSDSAGAVQSIPAIIEVIAGPTNAVAIAGANFQWLVRATGNAGPAASGYWWKTNGVNLATNAHYTGVSTTNLWITNVVAADAGAYSVGVTNVFGTVAPAATLTVISPVTTTQSLLWGQSATFTVPTAGPTPTYQWKKNNVNITGANGSSLILANVTSANAGTYTCGVTNGLGVLCTNGVLMVSNGTNLVGVPAGSVGGGNVVLAFSSPNNLYDTTNAFMLLQSPVVLPINTPWTTNTSAVWTTNGASPPMFQVTVPDTGGNMFYKLQHVP